MPVADPSPVLEHPTAAEREARGKAARADVPRSAHAEWKPPKGRRSPVELLEEQAATRVPELVPLRYGRMLVSAFTFYRGAAYLMAADLAGLPRTSLQTQLCGDAHLSNFGVYAAPDRSLVFDVNDFDETLPGPFEWDLKRLVTSFAVAGRDRGFRHKQRAEINQTVSRAYREAMRGYAGLGNLDLWYSRISVEEIMERINEVGSATQVTRAQKNLAKARRKGSMRALGKLTEVIEGEPRIRNAAPVIERVQDLVPADGQERLDETIRGMVRDYRSTLPSDRRQLLERFRYVDAARKVVGVGSVGTRAWIMLMLGRDNEDPLFLQFKEAEASVLEPFLGKSEFSNHGERVVAGQVLTQAASDVMLGHLRVEGPDGIERDYYVRQLWDAKGSALVETFNAKAMTEYAQICGRTLARAHARAGDAIAIASYLGRSETFDRALADFGEAYADQNQADFEVMQAAVAEGVIGAETGV